MTINGVGRRRRIETTGWKLRHAIVATADEPLCSGRCHSLTLGYQFTSVLGDDRETSAREGGKNAPTLSTFPAWIAFGFTWRSCDFDRFFSFFLLLRIHATTPCVSCTHGGPVAHISFDTLSFHSVKSARRMNFGKNSPSSFLLYAWKVKFWEIKIGTMPTECLSFSRIRHSSTMCVSSWINERK